MADDIPLGGTPPDDEMDHGVELIPLSERQYTTATYRPAIHVLPPDGLRQFRSFDRHVPPELLLCEPTSHLSFGASEVTLFSLLYFLQCRIQNCRSWLYSLIALAQIPCIL